MPSLYFHGLPGSAAELFAYGPDISRKASHFAIVQRANSLTRDSDGDYFENLASQIAAEFPHGPLHLTGFSLGAATALRVAPYLGDRVTGIDLVSPAGPLSLGDFLEDMAGAPVFRAALAGRLPFAVLTFLQAQASRLAAGRVAKALMAGAAGEDRALADDTTFLSALSSSLRQSLLTQRAAYQHEISAYVADWAHVLSKVTQPVRIWQGSEDNWTPPAMARALSQALPNFTGLTLMPDLSHFSTLRRHLQENGQ